MLDVELIANRIIQRRRDECPDGIDPECVIATAVLLTAAIVIAAASAGIGAYSAKAQADAQEDAAKYNAAVARNNAIAASQQADFEAGQIRDRNRRLLGAQSVSLAKSGVDISMGSSMDVMLDSQIQGELDRAAAIYQGKVSSGNQTAQARLKMMEAGFASRQGNVGAASSILAGASSATSIYANPNFRGTGNTIR